MKSLPNRIALVIALALAGVVTAAARPVNFTSGYVLLSGTDYGTNAYQTYLRFDLSASARMPRRTLRFLAEQPYSVFLNFPEQPQGAFEYNLVMPYAPQQMQIDGEFHTPVWYGDSVWKFSSSVVTPAATAESPMLTIVSAPFTMAGSTVVFGSYNCGIKSLGHGTLQVQFQKIATKYYMRDAYFAFGDSQLNSPFSQ